ncbi:hypothetical protein EOM33_07090 [Candidatus Saccharibacteria bacterium]|nr:hypothetical protein [Candidatus Saccharibacteria bacterium]
MNEDGWKPCYPGGKDTPENRERVLVVYYSHKLQVASIGDQLTLEIVTYFISGSGGRYWSNTCRSDVHPLCWHAMPALPPCINSLIQEVAYKDAEDSPVSTYTGKKGTEHHGG